MVAQDDVLREVELQHQPAAMPVLGHVRDPRRDRATGAVVRDVAAQQLDGSGLRPSQADDGLDQLRLPVAADPGDAQDLAAAHLEPHALDGLQLAVVVDPQVAHLQRHLFRGSRGLLHREHHVAAHHHARESDLVGLGRPGLPDDLPVSHDHDAVGRGHHLVELVGDEHHRQALLHQGPDDLEQLADLLRRQYRGGLVQDEDPGALVERLEDLHALLHADGEVHDARVRLDLEAVALRQLAHGVARLVEVDHATPGRLPAKHDVLGHRERLHQHEVLVDHADAQVDRLPGPPYPHRGPVDEYLARVGSEQAVDDVHESGLARAVLAEQGHDLTRLKNERDVVVGDDAREDLRHAAQFENRHNKLLPARRGLAFRRCQRGRPA